MNYIEFKTFTQQSMKKIYPNATISIQEVEKNNDVLLDALIISEFSSSSYAPTIYLNEYFKNFCDGTPMIDIISSIQEIYDKHRSMEPFDISFFQEFEKAKNTIIFKVINYDKNKNLLKKTPYYRYLDLAIVFYCLVSSNSQGNASILIKNEHLHLWNIKKDELHYYATRNTPTLSPYEFKEMYDILNEFVLETSDDDFFLPDESSANALPMYVLSNHKRINGATCLIYENLLFEISQKLESDYYILPSSIHELIIIPAKDNSQYQELSEMVQNVNESQLLPEEFLSDHVYFFSRKTKAISM